MNSNLKTSVNELLSIFRGALIAIIPWLEKIKIKWEEGESYDDWDNIAIALYQNIVCSSLTGEITPEYSIAKYGFQYNDYSGIDFIQARSKEHDNKHLVFVSFQSKSTPFDSVKVAILDNTDKTIGYLILKQDDLEYVFVKNINGKKKVINEIDIVI